MNEGYDVSALPELQEARRRRRRRRRSSRPCPPVGACATVGSV